MSVCVSLLFPVWLPSSAFADVGPNVVLGYWYHTYGAQFLSWRLTFAETAKALPTRGGEGPSVVRTYETPIFLEAKS